MKPPWLKVKIQGQKYNEVIRSLEGLNTICFEAKCPNIGECFSKGTATFLILGDNCTRNCQYCNVSSGKTRHIDIDEPKKIAQAVSKLKLNYAVITSVTRDDLSDGGANQFFDTVKEIKKLNPSCKVEILTPDFKGDLELLKLVLLSEPYVFNHNIEVVKEIFSKVRPEGKYNTSIKFLKYAKNFNVLTKSGFMVGLGETTEQIFGLINELASININILTIGQYIQPRKDRLKVKKYYTPKEFNEFGQYAKKVGIKYVASAPLVRSSYNASELIS